MWAGEDFVAPRLCVISKKGGAFFFFSWKKEKKPELQAGICFFLVLHVPLKYLYFSLLLPLLLPGRRRRRGEGEDEKQKEEGIEERGMDGEMKGCGGLTELGERPYVWFTMGEIWEDRKEDKFVSEQKHLWSSESKSWSGWILRTFSDSLPSPLVSPGGWYLWFFTAITMIHMNPSLMSLNNFCDPLINISCHHQVKNVLVVCVS